MSTRKHATSASQMQESAANKLDLRNEIQQNHSERVVPWSAWVFDALQMPRRGEVLDLGSGTGSIWAENAARLPRGCRIVMTDTGMDMLRQARTASSLLPKQAAIFAANSQSIPFADHRFDMVTAMGLLDLVPDIDRALQEARRVLKPGGTFVATAGGKGHLQELESLLLPYLPEEQARSIGGDEDHFGMENGQAALSRYFETIKRRDFFDRMVFGELQPVLNYLLSEHAVTASLTLEQLGDLVGRIKQRLVKNDALTVTIHKGLFIATK